MPDGLPPFRYLKPNSLAFAIGLPLPFATTGSCCGSRCSQVNSRMSRAIPLQCVHAQNRSAGMAALGFEAVMDQTSDTGQYKKGDVVVIEGWADPDGNGPKKGNPG